VIEAVATVLRGGQRAAILLGGRALREDALLAAGRIAAATGTTLYAEGFPTRLQRGAGLPEVERLAYLGELASIQLGGLQQLILADAKAPVSPFAYPGKPSCLVPDGCAVHELVGSHQDVLASLQALVDTLGAADVKPATPDVQQPGRPQRPTGRLSAEKVCQAVGAILPEGAILSEEAGTSG
jgi:acetolactate synthase I/II/III large subunit